MKMNMQAFSDPFLRTTDDVKPRIGLTAFEEALSKPRPSLTRTYELLPDNEIEQKHIPKHAAHLLVVGAAVGRDTSGKCVHFYPTQGIEFLGLLMAQTETLAAVRTRCSAVVRVFDVTKATPRGTSVFASGPNRFHIGQKPGSALVGVIRHVEGDNRAAVFFQRADDPRPPYLKL